MQQNDFLRRRQEGTCEWFITATQYEAWLRDRGAVLYCPGIPGSGKTIVASVVIDNLINRFHASPSVGVAYIYFDFRSHATQKPDKLLASLLKQLLERQQNIPEALAVLHRRWRNVKTEPTIKELLTSLQLVLNSLMRAFIVIDALDECQTSDGCRSAFLSILLSLQSSHKINVLATSRFTPDMSELFVGHETLEILARDGDVQTYIAENISQLPRFVARNESLKQHIITKIVESIDGMYVVIYLRTKLY
jgi:Cdc6-like AAA superfamily ATPase